MIDSGILYSESILKSNINLLTNPSITDILGADL